MSTYSAAAEKALDRRILKLESRLSDLRKRKLSLLQSRLREAQNEMSRYETGVTGKGAGRLSAGGRRGKKGPRGPRLSDEEVVSRLRAAVQSAGADGISAREASERAGVFYLRAIKVMNRAFKKSGSGKWTRYRLK